MDNTTTTHRRVNGSNTRLAYKIHQDYSYLFKKFNINDYRYLSEPWASDYKRQLVEINHVVNAIEEIERKANERTN
jgi:TorA maturation chaperone TorD